MGIIRHNGSYSIDYYVRDSNGGVRRKREKVGTNYKLAKELLTKRQAEANEQKLFPERQEIRVLFSDVRKPSWDGPGSTSARADMNATSARWRA